MWIRFSPYIRNMGLISGLIASTFNTKEGNPEIPKLNFMQTHKLTPKHAYQQLFTIHTLTKSPMHLWDPHLMQPICVVEFAPWFWRATTSCVTCLWMYACNTSMDPSEGIRTKLDRKIYRRSYCSGKGKGTDRNRVYSSISYLSFVVPWE